MYSILFAQMGHQALSGAGQPPNPAALAGMMQYQGLSFLLQVVDLFLNAVLYCAVFRAVIHPDQDRFAFMRLSMTELFIFVLMIGEFIVFFFAMLFAGLLAGLVIGLLSVLHAAAVAVLVGFILGGLGLWGAIYVALRLGMIGPMMVEDGKFHFGDAWALAKGRTGALFIIGVCVFVILFIVAIVLEIVVVALAMGIGMSAMGTSGGPAITEFFKQNPAAIVSKIMPFLIFAVACAVPIYGAMLAVMGAPWARAYLDLRHNPAEAF
jgi:hypothetical protein